MSRKTNYKQFKFKNMVSNRKLQKQMDALTCQFDSILYKINDMSNKQTEKQAKQTTAEPSLQIPIVILDENAENAVGVVDR